MLKKTVLCTTAVLSLIVSALPASADAPSKVQVLIDHWHVANLHCRGGNYEEASIKYECRKRDYVYGPQLDRLGWCYGKKSEAGYLAKWHKCTRNSERH